MFPVEIATNPYKKAEKQLVAINFGSDEEYQLEEYEEEYQIVQWLGPCWTPKSVKKLLGVIESVSNEYVTEAIRKEIEENNGQ